MSNAYGKVNVYRKIGQASMSGLHNVVYEGLIFSYRRTLMPMSLQKVYMTMSLQKVNMFMSLQKQVCGLSSLIKVITPIQSNAFKLNIKHKKEFIQKLIITCQVQ